MENDELWSSTLYPCLDPQTQLWVIAFDDDGQRYADSTPQSDFYAPVPNYYATKEGAEAAIAVLKVWEAPVLNEEDVLGFDELRATPEWAALVPHFEGAQIGTFTEEEFQEAEEMGLTGGLPGAYDHYLAITEEKVTLV